jgi:hypothetical protein
MRTTLATVCVVVGALVGCTGDNPAAPTVDNPKSAATAIPSANGPVESAAKKKDLKVDQSNSVSDQLGLGYGLYGQTFTPKAKNLCQADVLLIVNQVQVGLNTTLGLYTDITKAPVASTSAMVEPRAPGEMDRTISYRFDPPVPLERGATYTLGLSMPPGLTWEFAYDDPYPRGQAVGSDGVPVDPAADFVFTTWERK